MRNPHELSHFYHYYLAFEDLEEKGKVLDYGSGDGEFIASISKRVKEAHGYEVDPEKIRRSKKYENVILKKGNVGEKLPYKDKYFDAVFMFHVLEHVDSEKRAISEISRVLKNEGTLYLASPYKGLFAWADTANLRFRFPKLHRSFSRLVLGEKEFNKRFVENKKTKLYGDCSENRTWHKHYTESEIRSLLKSFEIENFHKFSLFHPFLLVFGNIYDFFFHRSSKFIDKLVTIDNKINAGKFSYNMYVIAKRK